jgi:hypothetical protein
MYPEKTTDLPQSLYLHTRLSENYFRNQLSIITKLVNSIPANGEVHSMQLYAMQFVGDCGRSVVLLFTITV